MLRYKSRNSWRLVLKLTKPSLQLHNRNLLGYQRKFGNNNDHLSFSTCLTNFQPQVDRLKFYSDGHFCVSCGVGLQTEDFNKPGFVDESVLNKSKSEVKTFKKRTDLIFEEYYNDLSEKEKLLLSNEDISEEELDATVEEIKSQEVKEEETEEEEIQEESKKGIKCLRCYNILHRGEYFELDPISNQANSLSSIVQNPKVKNFESSVIYNIISANDFPLGVNFQIFDHVTNLSKIKFVISKCDLILDHERLLGNAGKLYFFNTLEKLMKKKFGKDLRLEDNQVHLVSAEKNWNIKSLYNLLPRSQSVYFVGEANSGKSSLIKSFLEIDYYDSSTSKTKSDNLNTFTKKHQKELKEKINLPGTFVLPGFTQDILTYILKNGRATINDLPGYLIRNKVNDEINYGVFNILKDSWIKNLYKPKSQKIQKNFNKASYSLHKSKEKYLSIVDNDCYTFGGLIFVVGPRNNITQIKTNTREEGFVYGSLEKAFTSCERQPDAMKAKIGIKEGTKLKGHLKRYVIPPFYGSIDLVIKGIGFVTLTPTRSLKSLMKLQEVEKTEGEEKGEEKDQLAKLKEFFVNYVKFNLYEFYAPAGLEVIIRESIDSYLVKKNDFQKKSGKVYKEARPFISSKPIFSQPFEVPESVENVNQWFFESHLKGKVFDIWTGYENKKSQKLIEPMRKYKNKQDREKELIRVNMNRLLWEDLRL